MLAGCGGEQSAAAGRAGPCEIVVNGTPTPKTTASAAVPSRDTSAAPETATGYRKDMTAVHTSAFAVATANPLATRAACEVLRDGGTAADALVTAQTVLGLVEPQSSGIGGGGFLLYYDAAAGSVQAYDGREVAPAAATENYLRWVSDTDRTEPKPDARALGPLHRSARHRAHADRRARRARQDSRGGTCSHPPSHSPTTDSTSAPGWRPPSPTRHRTAARRGRRRLLPQPGRQPRNQRHTTLTNPAYAKTLGAIAADPQSFYTGETARDIVAAAADTVGRPHPEPD